MNSAQKGVGGHAQIPDGKVSIPLHRIAGLVTSFTEYYDMCAEEGDWFLPAKKSCKMAFLAAVTRGDRRDWSGCPLLKRQQRKDVTTKSGGSEVKENSAGEEISTGTKHKVKSLVVYKW